MRIDLMRVSVGGYTMKVLRGGFKFISEFKPRFMMITVDTKLMVAMGDDPIELYNKLTLELGYDIYIESFTGLIINGKHEFEQTLLRINRITLYLKLKT